MLEATGRLFRSSVQRVLHTGERTGSYVDLWVLTRVLDLKAFITSSPVGESTAQHSMRVKASNICALKFNLLTWV